MGKVGKEQSVGNLDLSGLCIEQANAYGLRGPLHLFHLGLHSSVGPNTSVGAHVAADGEECARVAIAVEREVEHCIISLSFTVSQTFAVDGNVVHLGVCCIGGHRVYGVVAGNASDVDGVGEVAQDSAFTTATSSVSAALVSCFWSGSLLRALQLSVDVEFHLLSVPRCCYVVPVAYPVFRKVNIECVLQA